MTTRVLYLGWWSDAADVLARHGCEAAFVVPAAEREAPARHGFTGPVVVVPEVTRLDDVVAGLIRDGVDPRGFDVICSEHEECIVPAAVLAAAYGRAGLTMDTAVALRDKLVQKRLVRNAGLPVAGCRTVHALDEPGVVPPFVVKPLSGVSTQHTYVVRGQEALERVTAVLAASGRQGPWLVEEYMTGGEMHADGVVRDGRLLFLGLSRYLQNLIEIQDGGLVGSVTVDPGAHPGLYRQVRELASAALKALGHTDGVFHMELFDQGDRLAFSECAGRIGGGMVLETTAAKFGVDLYDEWARAVLGRPSAIGRDRRYDTRAHGWVHLIARPGRVRAMPAADDVRDRPCVTDVQMRVGPGDTVQDSATASNARAATVSVAGETEDGLAGEMRALARWFRDRVHVEAPA